jgi:transposase
MAVRTWAPAGETPILRVKLSREHLSAMGGISLDGRLFLQVRPTSSTGAAVVKFLRVLLRKISGKVVVIWDGAPIHRSQEVKALLKTRAGKRLHLEQLPGYAPELNPAEGIWQYLKRVELGTVCCTDLDHLQTPLIRARERLPHKRDILRSCSRQCGSLL